LLGLVNCKSWEFHNEKNVTLAVFLIGVAVVLGQFSKSPFKIEVLNAEEISYSL
jgi:hypothetical protein